MAENQRDLVLKPGEYAYVCDETKGNVETHCGPLVSNLSGTQKTVIFDQGSKRFQNTAKLEDGIKSSIVAPEGWYLTVYNPALDNKVPEAANRSSVPKFHVGHKIVIHGPVNFIPWPGQIAKLRQGHVLRSNQYLLIRVYDEKSAREGMDDTLFNVLSDSEWLNVVATDAESDAKSKANRDAFAKAGDELIRGRTFIIKGTEVNFFMPTTGIEVVKDGEGADAKFVREAVTLERLEYCVLIDENGNKRNIRGPAVVFPEPTEIFKMTKVIRDDGTEQKTRKFRAYELTKNSGIHLKVIAPYIDKEDGEAREEGDELFFTGKDTKIYFPKEQEAIIKYDDREIHYAIAIPSGEARYVMNRDTGEIRLQKGPDVFLPDPRTEVIVRKALDLPICKVLYPGNKEALAHNAQLLGIDLDVYEAAITSGVAAEALRGEYKSGGGSPIRARSQGVATNYMLSNQAVADTAHSRGLRGAASKDFGGDSFDRQQTYSGPRTLTLITKYDGAVQLIIQSGYAVMLVSKGGDRRVVQGPQVALLEYDETPQVLKLSTGRPKTGATRYSTAYLRVIGNKVTDRVEVMTSDYVKAQITVSYRLSFEGDSTKWFEIEDYVGFLADHMRSVIRNAIMKYPVSDFFANSVDILRDVVLGEKDDEDTKRPGRKFEENGMNIYDLDVLGVAVDQELERRLIAAQRAAFDQALTLQEKEQKLALVKKTTVLDLETSTLLVNAQQSKLVIDNAAIKAQMTFDLGRIEANSQVIEAQNEAKKDQFEFDTSIERAQLARDKEKSGQELDLLSEKQKLQVAMIQAEVMALVTKAEAISPDLISALESFGQREVLEKAFKAMGPMSLLGGETVADIMKKMFEGTPLAKLAQFVTPTAPNGNGSQPSLKS